VAKRRVYEIAKERGLTNQEVVDRLRTAGLEVKTSVSTVEDVDVERVYWWRRDQVREGDKGSAAAAPEATARLRAHLDRVCA
jgi:translation initiation factor IF-2